MSNSPNSPTVRPQEDHEGLQVVPDDGLQTPEPEESPMDRDVKFQPYSAAAAYGGTLNVSEPGFDVPPGPESPPPAFHLINEYKISNNNTLPIEDSPPSGNSLKKKRICGLRKRIFWLLILLLFLAIVGLAVGLGIGLSGSKSTSSEPPTPISSFSTSSSTPGTKTSSATPSTTSPIGQTCVNGTGPGNYLGLCNFSCNFGYCPSPCTCLQFSSTAIPAPPITNTPGFPLPGENPDYTGLCSFTCNHGYCPEGACTTDSDAAGAGNSSMTTAAAVSTPSSVSSSLLGSSAEPLTLTPPTSTVVVTLVGSQTSTVVVGPSTTTG
ncbi:373a714b-f20b-4fa6-bc2c-b2c6c21641f5-CDS [Sclerotinia trifoliorum]|uniref:373a714b-f20b-4fa6-bc2c-b2c6c21641f5-CDS n=1 Tax=Sclerotinia trifoliorum TaxID=28548 RepID=A0A8H2ZRU7_9HELO|nr:373a714b-f20b-4fa6-bc2c-b2c6c21641f5-CDS [Sclerotinia trifoliorum]